MGRRAVLVQACLLAGCLSSPREGGDEGSAGDCERIPLEESFDDPDWRAARWDESWEGATGMLDDSGGRAKIVGTGVADDYAAFVTTESYEWADHCVEVEVPQMLDHQDGNAAEALIGVEYDDLWITMGQSDGWLCCQLDVLDVPWEEHCETPYDPALHRWWRMRFEGPEVACDVAAAQGDWKEFARLDLMETAVVGALELYAGSWLDVEDLGTVAFDNINR